MGLRDLLSGTESHIPKLLERLSSPEVAEREKTVSRMLALLPQQGPAAFAAAAPPLVQLLADDEVVWQPLHALVLALHKADKRVIEPVIPSLVAWATAPAPTGPRCLQLLAELATQGLDLRTLPTALHMATELVELGDPTLSPGAVALLQAAGLEASRYAVLMAPVRERMAQAHAFGAETAPATTAIGAVRELFLAKRLEEAIPMISAVQEQLRAANKLVPLWYLQGQFHRAALSPDGEFIALANEDELRVLNPAGTQRWGTRVPGRIHRLMMRGSRLMVTVPTQVLCFDLEGKVLWRHDLPVAPTALTATEEPETYVALADNTIMRIGPGGASQPPVRVHHPVVWISCSAQGELVVAAGDGATLQAYDARLNPRWRFPGGRWATVNVSFSGASVLAGTDGREVVAVSGTGGGRTWKAILDRPVLAVSTSKTGRVNLAADATALYHFSLSGQQIWKMAPGEEIRFFAADALGINLVLVTASGVRMYEHLDGWRNLVEHWTPLMEMGTPTPPQARERVKAAIAAFKANRYDEGASIARQALSIARGIR